MNLVPGLLLLWYGKRWKRLFPAYDIWFWLAIAAVVNVVLVDFATTAVDRISLYFTPLQVAVFARLPVLARNQFSPRPIRSGILAGYALVLYRVVELRIPCLILAAVPEHFVGVVARPIE